MAFPLLVPAAGSGQRMGADRNKLLLKLGDRPVLHHTLATALAATAIAEVVLMGQAKDFPAFAEIVAALNPAKPVRWVLGGATRQASVYAGLQALAATTTGVLIHDGARCLATPDLFDRGAAALAQCDGFVAAVPVKDTIKEVVDRQVVGTPPRDRLWAAQTPQGFAYPKILDAHRQALAAGWEVTDDAALFEKLGWPVAIVPGEETNLKITTPQDLAIAQFLLAAR
ncbi:MAG: 2-C-methyl-D-erythritol 4-phosphate cytidylyltransferase [Oscillatoriales cyanobacterium SM2_1_8]|nr:2-C-methyl-D-erythritol 4-phosphate cytidylyltransferase [Oscillatoriales cyanobacterium SM2_1_8]